MSQRNIMLVMLVSVIPMFGALVIYDVKVNHRLEKVLGKDTNWKWNDKWTPNSKEQPKIQEPPQKEGEEETKPESQVEASDYNDAVKQSGELGMPIAIVFRADWCHWCKKLEEETLVDSNVKSMMMNYVFLTVDTDKDSSTARKFGVSGLPSYVITNASGEKLKSGSGFKSGEAFSKWLDEPSMFKQPKQKQDVTPPNDEEDDEEDDEDIKPKKKRKHRADDDFEVIQERS